MLDEWYPRVAVEPSEPATTALKETLALKEALKARVHLFQARLHAKVYMCKYVYQLGFWFFVLNSTTQLRRFTDRKLYGFCEIFLGSIYSYINCVRLSKA